MYKIERKAEILGLLEKQGEVDVNQLAQLFSISRESVRRDLTELEREGVLTRAHGGAIFNRINQDSKSEYPVGIRSIQNFNEKTAICKRAAELIQDKDTIFIDNSSTTTYLIQYIPKNIHITILTNSIKLLIEAAKISNPNITFICFGGIFKESNLSFYGNTTLKNAGEYFPNKTFMSCAGIRSDGLLTDSSLDEVDAKKLMLENSQDSYFLIDNTKFSVTGQVILARLSKKDTIIIDEKTKSEDLTPISNLGVKVIIAAL